jgi:hypothetical protein
MQKTRLCREYLNPAFPETGNLKQHLMQHICLLLTMTDISASWINPLFANHLWMIGSQEVVLAENTYLSMIFGLGLK